MKYLYIGAWRDFAITELFPDIEEFVFVDTQPRNEHDDSCSIDDTSFERPNFMKQILTAATENNFKLISKEVLRKYSDREIRNPTLLTFKSDTQTINYYVSTNFRRDDIKELDQEIFKCSGLILSGYFPHKVLCSYLPPTTKLFCISGSVYSYDDERENIVNYLYENNYFYEMYAVLQDKKEFIKCNNMIEISNIIDEHFERTGN